MPDPKKPDMHRLVGALSDVARQFKATTASVCSRGPDDQLLSITVHAIGDEAKALERWLKRREARHA